MSDHSEEESDEEQTKGPKLPSTVFIEEGKLQFRIGNFRKAIENFDTVLESEPTNVKVLVARSQAYSQLMDYAQAMRDTEDALKLDPRCPAAICQKGEIQYIMGDFEFAYITFQRGSKQRPDYEKFRYGLQKCKAAILNAIGPESNLKLTDEDVRMVEERLQKRRDELFSGKKAIKKDDSVETKRKPKASLGKMEKDRKFFEGVLESKYIHHILDPNDRKIKDCSERALDFLSGRGEFWQMEQPLHSRKRRPSDRENKMLKMNDKKQEDGKAYLEKQPENTETCFEKPPEDIEAYLEKPMDDTETCLEKRPEDIARSLEKPPEDIERSLKIPPEDTKTCSEEAPDDVERGLPREDSEDINVRKVVNYYRKSIQGLDDETLESIQKKQELMRFALHVLGGAYNEISDLESAIQTFMEQVRIMDQNDLTDEEYNAIYDVGVEYISKKDYIRAIPIFEELLVLADTDTERGYLLNAIAQCQILLEDTQAATDAVERTLQLAKENENMELEMRTIKLFAEIQVINDDMKSAAYYFEYALELAILLANTNAEDEIKKRKEELGLRDDDEE